MPPVDDLYRSHWSAVHAHCRRILRDAAAAEDAAQETFARAQDHLPRAVNREEALRWIYRVATNYCLNQIRNRELRRARQSEMDRIEASRDLAQVLSERSHARWLIREVPEAIAVVAWLHHVDDMGQQEIADLLGLSRRTIVNRLARFQERARQLTAGSPPRDGQSIARTSAAQTRAVAG